MAKTIDDRHRVWTFIGYPGDSLPDDYARILDNQNLCWAESPIHDADKNGDDTEKKKHIHFILTFQGKKSFEQVQAYIEPLNTPIPKPVANVRGLVRYFIHLDNPEKAQYKESDIKCHGGFDLSDYLQYSQTVYRNELKKIQQFCIDNDIHEFYQLADIVMEMDDNCWYELVTSKYTMYISQYLKSKHFAIKEQL